jgi:hypothetical protein
MEETNPEAAQKKNLDMHLLLFTRSEVEHWINMRE